MTVKEAIYQRVSEMSEAEAADLLDYLALLSDPDELTEDELAEVKQTLEEMRGGGFITLEALRAELEA